MEHSFTTPDLAVADRRLGILNAWPKRSVWNSAFHIVTLGALLLSIVFALPGRAQVAAVSTQHYDTNRTGTNLKENVLTTSNVNVAQFGKLFTRAVDGHIYAQPLYVANVTIPKRGTHNVVYIATQHDSVYAFDADFPGQSAPLWQVSLRTPRPAGFPTKYGIESGIQVEIGITSTPVIDTKSKTLYAVAYTQDSSTGPYHYRLHALDITSGKEKFGGPVEIQASVPGTGDGSVGGVITFDPKMHMQRPSLLLLNGTIYIAFGSFADSDPYHGWVIGYNASTLAQTGVYNTTPDGGEGAVWMSGQGLLGDSTGNLYFMVGNGSTTASSGRTSFGNSFLKLSGANLSLLDWFMPYNALDLANADLDVGSSGPILIPGTTLITGGGKQGVLYLVDTTNMGHFHSGSDSQIVQSFQASNDEIFNTPVFWSNPKQSLLYLWPDNQGLKALSFANGLFQMAPVAQNNSIAPAQPGGTLSLSASGTKKGTAILWATHSTAGSAETIAQPGELHAYDATNIANELWNSLQNPARDDTGRYGKFNPPTVANGKVYLGTFSEQLDVYGPLPLPVAPGQTLLTTASPKTPNRTDGVSYEQGTKFTSNSAGQIVAIRYWKAASETGTHVGHIWSSGGTELANVTFTGETPSGWQQAALSSPLSIAAQTTYIVSINTNTYYSETINGLKQSIVNGNLSTVADGANGVFGPAGTFPTSSNMNSNYFRDAAFVPSGGQSVFTTQTPAKVGQNDNTNYELGMKFTSDQAGQITAIRYWKDASETGPHFGHIWADNGGELAGVTFTNETASGWQTGNLTSPFTVEANEVYTVSVNINSTYVSTSSGLAGTITNGPLSTVADGSNGVFGTIGTFPTSSFQNANYFRDVVFAPSGACSVTQPPTALSASPGIAEVSLSWVAADGAITYNVKRSTTSGSGYVTVATGVTSTDYTDTGLTNGTTYYYVVTAVNPCGESANSGETSATPQSSFNGTSLFTTQIPAASYTDGPYELGLKFQSSQAGNIISIRYYKDPGESGAHTGRIWSATGAQLASVQFSNETSSGWQTANLSNPLPISANTVYVVTVNSNTGYGSTNQGLATSVVNSPLSTVADGNNGVYGPPGTFPTLSYQNSNYFRDVVVQ